MKMKKLGRAFPIFMVVVLAYSLFSTTSAKAAPTPAPNNLTAVSFPIDLGNGRTGICVIQPNGDQTCYEYQEPQYTDPTYSCPAGSTAIDGDPTHCLATSTSTVYTDRPQIPATYTCPDGYTQEGTTCKKLVADGYWDTVDRPITTPEQYICPPDYTWSYSYQGVIYSSLVSYTKNENDPHHCHRQSANILPSPVPGAVQGKYNQDNPENADTILVPAVYGSCPAGYAVAPDPSKCQKWIPPVYDYQSMIVDDPAHPGACPDGYEVYSETQCSKQVTENDTIDAIRTGGTPYCSEGSLVNNQCVVEVPCPPVDTTTICYLGETITVPTETLDQYVGYTAGTCTEPPPEKPKCLVGWVYTDPETGETSCRVTNWDFCNYLKNVHCQRHLNKFAGTDSTQLAILRYREATLKDPSYVFHQNYSDRQAARDDSSFGLWSIRVLWVQLFAN
jgi:hypothetical protein